MKRLYWKKLLIIPLAPLKHSVVLLPASIRAYEVSNGFEQSTRAFKLHHCLCAHQHQWFASGPHVKMGSYQLPVNKPITQQSNTATSRTLVYSSWRGGGLYKVQAVFKYDWTTRPLPFAIFSIFPATERGPTCFMSHVTAQRTWAGHVEAILDLLYVRKAFLIFMLKLSVEIAKMSTWLPCCIMYDVSVRSVPVEPRRPYW